MKKRTQNCTNFNVPDSIFYPFFLNAKQRDEYKIIANTLNLVLQATDAKMW